MMRQIIKAIGTIICSIVITTIISLLGADELLQGYLGCFSLFFFSALFSKKLGIFFSIGEDE